MAKLKDIITNLSTPFLGEIVNNFTNAGSQKDAGKVSAQLLKKGPFDIPESPSQKLVSNPLSFSPVQYPLDLGSNELGHYIIFESGFLGYSPQTSGFLGASASAKSGAFITETDKTTKPGTATIQRTKKISSKIPDRSTITTATPALLAANLTGSPIPANDTNSPKISFACVATPPTIPCIAALNLSAAPCASLIAFPVNSATPAKPVSVSLS